MAKKVPNPNGKKGSQKHQDLQTELLNELSSFYEPQPEIEVDKEVEIRIFGGKKRIRVADVAAYKTIQTHISTAEWATIIQIGQTDGKGNPIKRELEAIEDIEKATGIKVNFYDYENKKKIR